MSRELEVIKEDYVRSYSYMICQKLFELAPDIAKREFGTIENCIREVQDDAREWFEKWLPNWAYGIVSRVKEIR